MEGRIIERKDFAGFEAAGRRAGCRVALLAESIPAGGTAPGQMTEDDIQAPEEPGVYSLYEATGARGYWELFWVRD